MPYDFQGDILLKSTPDGGDIEVTSDNFIQNETGFDTAIFLSIFGGNESDNGTEATKKFEYWGNKIESDPKNKLTSRTQYIISGYPATSNNLNKIKEAINQDLAWMIEDGIIDELNVNLSLQNRNKLNAIIEGIKDKKKIISTKYELNWNSKIS